MIRFLLIICVFSIVFNDLAAQRCEVIEDINPLNDSLCWTTGTKDYVEIIIDKNTPQKKWISLSIASPGNLSSSVGDSAWLVLDDNYVIQLRNSKNAKTVNGIFKALHVKVDYYYINFLSEIKNDDIKRMTINKVKKMSFNFHPTFNSSYEFDQIKKSSLISKTSTYDVMNNHIAVRINKITRKQQKNILNIATCADKYIQ